MSRGHRRMSKGVVRALVRRHVLHAYCSVAGVDAVVTALVLAASQHSASASRRARRSSRTPSDTRIGVGSRRKACGLPGLRRSVPRAPRTLGQRPGSVHPSGPVPFTVPTGPRRVKATGVQLAFRDGEVVDALAYEGQDYLEAALATDSGERLFGENGIGTRTGIDRASATSCSMENRRHRAAWRSGVAIRRPAPSTSPRSTGTGSAILVTRADQRRQRDGDRRRRFGRVSATACRPCGRPGGSGKVLAGHVGGSASPMSHG
jgi:hypothetical protein